METEISTLFQIGFWNSNSGNYLTSLTMENKIPQLSWKLKFPHYFNLDFEIPTLEII